MKGRRDKISTNVALIMKSIMLDFPLNPPPSSPSGPAAPILDYGVLKQTL